MAEELRGAPVAKAIDERSRADIAALAEQGVTPTLALVRVGEREDDIAYESSAVKRCERVGAAYRKVTLPAESSQEELLAEIEQLNRDKSIHGVLLFLPLPKRFDQKAVRASLSPEKDVDGVTDASLAGVFTGNGAGFAPCTAQACIEILDYYHIDCTGKRAVVVGRSLVVGKPVAMLLLAKNATVTLCHTRTTDLTAVVRSGEIVVAAAGKAWVVGSSCFSAGQTVIDVGVNFVDGQMHGDADYAAASGKAATVTPVPGGVGTVTTSVLVNHVVEAAKRQCGG